MNSTYRKRITEIKDVTNTFILNKIEKGKNTNKEYGYRPFGTYLLNSFWNLPSIRYSYM